MTSPIPKKPIDLEEVESALDNLPPAKRRQTKTELLKLLPSVQSNHARGVPLAVIVKELKRLGIETSVKRLKDLIAAVAAQSANEQGREETGGAA